MWAERLQELSRTYCVVGPDPPAGGENAKGSNEVEKKSKIRH